MILNLVDRVSLTDKIVSDTNQSAAGEGVF